MAALVLLLRLESLQCPDEHFAYWEVLQYFVEMMCAIKVICAISVVYAKFSPFTDVGL